MDKAVGILSGIATALVVFGGLIWVWGAKLAVRQYQMMALYLLGSAVVVALIATILWAIHWVRKNVRIQ